MQTWLLRGEANEADMTEQVGDGHPMYGTVTGYTKVLS